jgi:hypothetical protein
MRDWQYFYRVLGRAHTGAQPRGLGRHDRSGPQYNAEMLNREARWVRSEFLERYYLLGTNEDDYVEIPEDRAIEIIEDWVASGRLTQWPDEPKRPAR